MTPLTQTERRVLGPPSRDERIRRYSCGNCKLFQSTFASAPRCTAPGGYNACRASLPLGVRPKLFAEKPA